MGRKLAVLEMAGESAHLYVFDVDSHDLITDLSAVGFGDTISTYCWDSMGGRLFSISGSSDITVHQYDFNVPTENKRHTDVDKKGCDEVLDRLCRRRGILLRKHYGKSGHDISDKT